MQGSTGIAVHGTEIAETGTERGETGTTRADTGTRLAGSRGLVLREGREQDGAAQPAGHAQEPAGSQGGREGGSEGGRGQEGGGG
eukprot:3738786-Rhodomonas_salina.1